MDDLNKQEQARKVYETLCSALDTRGWNYKEEMIAGNQVVRFGVNGDDIPMDLVLVVDAERMVLRCLSFLPFKFPENKRVEGAIAACYVSNGFADGGFDYDLSTGAISYRMVASYRGCRVGEELCTYMVDCTCAMVDRYNDRFMMLAKGLIDLETFLKLD